MLDQFLRGHSSRVCDISCSFTFKAHARLVNSYGDSLYLYTKNHYVFLWSPVAQSVECKTEDQRFASLRLTSSSHCVVSLSKTLYLLLRTGST